jgi:hypothetical protein
MMIGKGLVMALAIAATSMSRSINELLWSPRQSSLLLAASVAIHLHCGRRTLMCDKLVRNEENKEICVYKTYNVKKRSSQISWVQISETQQTSNLDFTRTLVLQPISIGKLIEID